MADKEKDTLKDIKLALMEANFKQDKTTKKLDKLNQFAANNNNLTQEQIQAVNRQRSDLQKSIDSVGKDIENLKLNETLESGFFSALSKFLGVDFVKEFFFRLDKNTKELRTAFGDLGKALGAGKLKKVASGFFDVLKKLFTVGLATVGILEFIEGWNKAEEVFGNNIDWTERFSTGIANVIASFAGLTDKEFQILAKDINTVVEDVTAFLKNDFKNLFESIRKSIPNIKGAFNGIKAAIGMGEEEDTILGGLWMFATNMGEIASNLWNSESMFGKIIVALTAIKVISTAAKAATALGSVFTALGSIFAILGAGSVVAGIAIAGAAVGLIAGVFNAFSNIGNRLEEFKKNQKDYGTILSALYLIDRVIWDIADGIVKAFTLGNYGMKDIENAFAAGDKWIYDKLTNLNNDYIQPVLDFITGVFAKLKSWVTDKFGRVAKWFGFDIKDPDDISVDNQNNTDDINSNRQKLIAAEKDNIALGNSKSYNDYFKKLKDLLDNKEISEEQYAKERMEAIKERSQTGQRGFQNFQNNQQTTNNNLIAQLKPDVNKWSGYGGSLSPSH